MSAYIPDPVVKRLPMYYRYLKELERNNQMFISSTELAKLTGLTASQVRQDVNAFGGEGRQGCGYPVIEMRKYIGKLLGKTTVKKMVVVGMGNLGRAIVRYEAFFHDGYQTSAVFDCQSQKTGLKIGPLTVQHIRDLESVLAENPADIAVLTLPASAAQEMAERLYRCGIRGFWNFAPVDLHLPDDASVVNVHLDESLELLSYRLNQKKRIQP
ncbi:MAG: redox-sensing transcriptional repressor Rex [Clostridia bacterium]|nr:redox-sensing transcriptional repressor Rex [Clostridia bacterium]